MVSALHNLRGSHAQATTLHLVKKCDHTTRYSTRRLALYFLQSEQDDFESQTSGIAPYGCRALNFQALGEDHRRRIGEARRRRCTEEGDPASMGQLECAAHSLVPSSARWRWTTKDAAKRSRLPGKGAWGDAGAATWEMTHLCIIGHKRQKNKKGNPRGCPRQNAQETATH